MNRFISLFFLLASLSAVAGTVSFNTIGSQLCVGSNGCGATIASFGQVVISYTPNPGETESAPSFTNLGRLIVNCVDGGTGCVPTSLPTSLTLYLQINQTGPTPASGFLPGALLSGTVSGKSSTALIHWSALDNFVTPDGAAYSVLNPILGLVPPANNNCGVACAIQPSGVTTIQGQVKQTATPEPGSILFFLTGFAAFLLFRKGLG